MLRPGPNAFVTISSLSTPFWNEMIAVSGPTTGLIWPSACSVSHSLTAKMTRSTTPMVAGSSVAVTFGSWNASGPVDAEASRTHRGEMGAARDEGYVGTALGEARAEITAHAARTHDRYAHRSVLSPGVSTTVPQGAQQLRAMPCHACGR